MWKKSVLIFSVIILNILSLVAVIAMSGCHKVVPKAPSRGGCPPLFGRTDSPQRTITKEEILPPPTQKMAGLRPKADQGEVVQPVIYFETNRFDFGNICKDEEDEYLFKFENRGNSKLIIHDVRTTCICTEAAADLTEIEPGGSGAIRVVYTANMGTGKFDKVVMVISNDPDSPHYVLRIRGEVATEVVTDPKFIDFGVIPTGESSTKSVIISNGCNNSFEVTGIECDTPLVTASYKENGDNEYIIEATFRIDAQANDVQGNIFVITKGLKQSRVKLPFYGRAGEDASASGKDAAFTIVFTGEESGYLEPCGCTEDQLGGISKRHTLITSLRGSESGVNSSETTLVVPISLGDLTDGLGRQSEIKMETITQALERMGYIAHNLGEKDIALGPELFNYLQMESRLKFLSSNVKFTDNSGSKIRSFLIKHVQLDDLIIKVGFLGILSPNLASTVPYDGFTIREPVSSLKPLIGVLKDRVDILVLLSHAEMEESISLAETFPELDLVISGHDVDELDAYEPEYINNTTVVATTGKKGKYAGIYRYSPSSKEGTVEIIPVSSSYADSPEMKELMKHYLKTVKDENLIAYEPKTPTPSGDTFVGSKMCGICHKKVHKHWETTTHASAYETLVKSEHDYDPDCVSCHVTGFQYTSGFASPEETPALEGVGCEDCHGPGSAHINNTQEEYGKTTIDTCSTCHIPEHSPKFEFTSFWEKITHPEEHISALGG